MTTTTVLSDFDRSSGVAILTFNRPDSLNAIDITMARNFLGAVKGLSVQPGLRCVVLRGAGRAFVAEEQFDDMLAATVTMAAEGPGRAFGAFRRLVDQASGTALADHLEAERHAFLEMTKTADFSKGVSAFLDKRKPRFQGC